MSFLIDTLPQNEALRGDIDSVSRQLRCVEEKLSEQLAAWRQELTASAQSRPDREEVAKLLSHKLDSGGFGVWSS